MAEDSTRTSLPKLWQDTLGASLLAGREPCGANAAIPVGDLPSWIGSSLELVESKLHPPPARPGIVARIGLVERLLASDGVPVVGVVAPAGYGKTTLLAQWAERTARRVGWVSVDPRDNDPRCC